MTSATVSPEDFDPEWYLQAYADVERAGVDPVWHFENYGFHEGRWPKEPKAPELETALWRGLEREARPQLERMLRATPSNDVAWAHWALARWHASHERWDEALALLRRFLEYMPWRRVLPH